MAFFMPEDPDEELECKLLLLGIVVTRDPYWNQRQYTKGQYEVVQLRDQGCFFFVHENLHRFNTKREAMEEALNAFEVGADQVSAYLTSQLTLGSVFD